MTVHHPAHPAAVPILALEGILPVTLQGEPHDGMAERPQRDIAHRVAGSAATGVVVDVSGAEIVDSFLGRGIAEIAAGARLPAARTVVCGMRPAVAITLTELGPTLPGVVTTLDVDRALELLRRGSAAGPGAYAGGT
ncbi:STAS domain-containing protein [Streptomyces sp. IBSBF 3136]|uniref:STAS domain-containing protein n=1 Tax=Streptomyces sp. IBSBF 3136 TaxID=2903524 RepID=UPI002FDBFF1F